MSTFEMSEKGRQVQWRPTPPLLVLLTLVLIALPSVIFAEGAEHPGSPRATPEMLAHPPVTPEPFLPLTGDASGHYHYLATFLKDYTELVFIVQEEGHHGIVSGRIGDAADGHVYPYTDGGGPCRGISADDGSPCYSIVEDRIYFISGRETKDGAGWKSYTIWYSEREADGEWQQDSTSLDLKGCGESFDSLSVSTDGALWLESDEHSLSKDGAMCRVAWVDGVFAEAETVDIIDLPMRSDSAPTVAPDESYIVFESWDADSRGQSDLYVVFRLNEWSWSDPMKLDNKVNTEADERYPRISSDGETLFFSRTQPETEDDWNEHYETQWVSTELVLGLRP